MIDGKIPILSLIMKEKAFVPEKPLGDKCCLNVATIDSSVT